MFELSEYDSLKKEVSALKSKRDSKVMILKEHRADLKRLKRRFKGAEEFQKIFQEVAKDTQRNLEEHISNIVTLALDAVGGDPPPPQFVVRIEDRRGGTEMDFLFKEGSREQHPLDSGSHGYANITDFAARVAYILLAIEFGADIRKTLILDEPFRDVQPSRQYKVSDMLRMMNKELGFQFIVSSHAEGINNNADKVFLVIKRNGVSHVEVEKR